MFSSFIQNFLDFISLERKKESLSQTIAYFLLSGFFQEHLLYLEGSTIAYGGNGINNKSPN